MKNILIIVTLTIVMAVIGFNVVGYTMVNLHRGRARQQAERQPGELAPMEQTYLDLATRQDFAMGGGVAGAVLGIVAGVAIVWSVDRQRRSIANDQRAARSPASQPPG